MRSAEWHIPRQLDAWKLVQQAANLQGYLQLDELPRLAAVLAAPDLEQRVDIGLGFGTDAEGHRVIRGKLHVMLPLVCQRCLERMEYPVDGQFEWGLVSTDEEARKLPAHLDPVVIGNESGQLDLHAMLEDELLLDLPMSAFHSNCKGDGSTRRFGDKDIVETGENQKPFAGLADLLKK